MRDPKTGKFIKGVDFSGRLPHNLAVSNDWVRDLELEMYKPSLEATRRPRRSLTLKLLPDVPDWEFYLCAVSLGVILGSLIIRF